MSSYEALDATILTWVKRHSLQLLTEYKESEVRSVEVVGKNGKRFQIWISRPNGGRVGVHVWNYKKMRKDWDVNIDDLVRPLDEALNTALTWGEEG